MNKLQTTVYSFAPMRDEFGEPDYKRLDFLTKFAAATVTVGWVGFVGERLIWIWYDNLWGTVITRSFLLGKNAVNFC